MEFKGKGRSFISFEDIGDYKITGTYSFAERVDAIRLTYDSKSIENIEILEWNMKTLNAQNRSRRCVEIVHVYQPLAQVIMELKAEDAQTFTVTRASLVIEYLSN